MHICCAPCAVWPLQALRTEGARVTGLWYNPNIHPQDEYAKRLSALRQLEALWELKVIHHESPWAIDEFTQALRGHSGKRCERCYAMRLERTAHIARHEGFDAFTTSLLVSPYQDIALIMTIGQMMSERYGVRFMARDFTEGFRQGRSQARDMGLYRQNYCGCHFSKSERSAQKEARV